jgi:phosphatidylserine synthase
MRWNIGYFGVKDLFTIINLMGGVGAIYFAFHGQLDFAGYALFGGFVFGDALDGVVARATNSGNKFGGAFDSVTDHLTQAISPAIVAYAAFAAGDREILGMVIMSTLILTATIRQARYAVADFDYPLTYAGLPRTVSGLVAVSLPNSTLFFKESVIQYEGAAAVLILVALMNLIPIPYMTHKGKRRMQTYVKILVGSFLVLPFGLLFIAPQFLWDFLFFCTFGYALGAWIPIYPHERREYWAEYKRWAHEVATRR